jgi:hypothetical protein
MIPNPSPSSTRKSERLEKRTLTPTFKRKSQRIEKKGMPSLLRKSDRGKKLSGSTSSGSKKSNKSSSSSGIMLIILQRRLLQQQVNEFSHCLLFFNLLFDYSFFNVMSSCSFC